MNKTLPLNGISAFSYSWNTYKDTTALMRLPIAIWGGAMGLLGKFQVSVDQATKYLQTPDNTNTFSYKPLLDVHPREVYRHNIKERGVMLMPDPLNTFQGERTILSESYRPINRKIAELNPELKVSAKEVENLEYRIVADEKKVIQKLAKAKTAALQAGTTEAIVHSNDYIQGVFRNDSIHNKLFNDQQQKNGSIKVMDSYNYSNFHDVHFDTLKETPEVAVAHCIGNRKTMEDNHIAELFSATVNGKTEQIQVTGVFDGHGSRTWANYAPKYIVQRLKETFELINNPKTPTANIWNAIKIAFVNLDRTLEEDYPDDYSGTTANIAIKIGKKLWIANLGDSRAILVGSGGPHGSYTQLSEDAKPTIEKYASSVLKRGGFISKASQSDYQRVNGVLTTTKSLGDNDKRHGGTVSARPTITCYEEGEYKDKALVQVCDGVTDAGISESIGHAVNNDLTNGNSPAVTAARLVSRSVDGMSTDNMTAMITLL
ncbi:PP2C family protein-serine/threonine phosphatase [uncultured Endozoicomonas sp.]|uniref:PP2C family serine/threonine-protein phosphatase n=1 Tax=uncultured Endozoicomonas sp. TaxID=432652 RepID=UPI002629AC59|nr:PP2C family protein-serine/threonine phosphatase [uncultured Endozoicomonas sp.]